MLSFRLFCRNCMFVYVFTFVGSGIFAAHRMATRCPKINHRNGGNLLISCTSSSASRAGAICRHLLTWAVATTMACGTVGLSGATTSVHAATGPERDAAHQQVKRDYGPWPDTEFVKLRGATDAYEGHLFAVAVNHGVPWVYDPRLPAGQRWQSLRRVPGSRGNHVFKIAIGSDQSEFNGSGDVQLLIRARTARGTFETRCDVQTAGATSSDPVAQVLFPTDGPLINCTRWAASRSSLNQGNW